MDNLNKVMLMGKVKGAFGLNAFMLETTIKSFNRAGEEFQETSEHLICVKGKTAESCKKLLQDGSKVLVEGRICNNPEIGYKIFASDITFISGVKSLNKLELLQKLIKLRIDHPCLGEEIDYLNDEERKKIYRDKFKHLTIDELNEEIRSFEEAIS